MVALFPIFTIRRVSVVFFLFFFEAAEAEAEATAAPSVRGASGGFFPRICCSSSNSGGGRANSGRLLPEQTSVFLPAFLPPRAIFGSL